MKIFFRKQTSLILNLSIAILLGISFTCIWFTTAANAQIIGPITNPEESIKRNSVSVMDAWGDTLWIGPSLQRKTIASDEWYLPDNIDSLEDGRGVSYSIDAKEDTIVAGLGYSVELEGSPTDAGMGFYLSVDGGTDWEYIEQPLESRDDTLLSYGGQQLPKNPVVVPQQSPPYDVEFHKGTIMSANWASGIWRSTDYGENWNRMPLPPSSVTNFDPDNDYEFNFDPVNDNNFLGFGLMIKDNGEVWAGTAGGINISSNALDAPTDSIRWRHIGFDDSSDGLIGNWIITIKEQPNSDRIWMTNWPSQSRQAYGLVSTTDGGQSFSPHLVGEQLYDVDFANGKIYAVGDNGLFVSSDNGNSWTQINNIRATRSESFIKSSADYLSVETMGNTVWVGTSDGLAVTSDDGQNWSIYRVNMPLKGGNKFQEDAPDVDTYAYPNPYSPRRHEIVRLKFNVQEAGNVKIRIFDYGSNLVRTINNGSYSPGTYEAVWDGEDNEGLQVANGTYFYHIDLPGGSANGKILVLD